MKRIHKYVLDNASTQRVAMPQGAQILCVQAQAPHICLWAMVDADLPSEQRTIRVEVDGAGVDGADSLKYIGTVQLAAGIYVFHVFEVRP